ncbi:MAG: hypothetical protein DI537_20365 [Stutzerimonas stutzeri]|nr:MAG: hypothetical protein DI537_20365 [Stutzerimonas stutzeri]
MRLAAIAIGCALATGAAAETVVDDSAARVDADKLKGAIARLSQEMRDPSSIQVRNVAPSRLYPQNLICGEYNAKNLYGTYVGFRRFYSNGEALMIEENDPISKASFSGSGCS